MPAMLRLALFAAAVLAGTAAAAQNTGSRCLALAEAAPQAIPVAYVKVQDGLQAPQIQEVRIRFIGHATFLIESPRGVTIATDFTGFAGAGVTPRIVTMNRAHSSHYTSDPDPAIEHVLRGWNPDGGRAEHHLTVEDVLVRNVTTDIRSYGGFEGGDSLRVPDGNSIFIIETGQLCIGHLGHLHHELGSDYLGLIGQLDVVMVPVDGSYTMAQDSMVATLQVLKARLILPMHYFGQATLGRFLARLGEDFDVETSASPEVTVSVATLPQAPKVLVLPGY